LRKRFEVFGEELEERKRKAHYEGEIPGFLSRKWL
jgi:hypothetical protein